MNFWIGQLEQGVSPTSLGALIAQGAVGNLAETPESRARAQEYLNSLNGSSSSGSNYGSVGTGSSIPSVSGSGSSLIDSIYQSVLGRSADSEGARFWSSQLASGAVSSSDLATQIALGAASNSAESATTQQSANDYLHSLGVPGYARGGDFGGGLRLVGENGPELEVTGPSRIYNAQQTAALLGCGAATAEEVRGLRTELASLKDYFYRIAKNTQRSSSFLERWDYDGLPEARAV